MDQTSLISPQNFTDMGQWVFLEGESYGNGSTTPGWCPEIFDGILCWPGTPPGVTVNQTCPISDEDINSVHLAFKKCLSNGTWYLNDNNITWTDYSQCSKFSDALLEFHKSISFLYIVGYVVSSLALIASLVIFFSFRTLRCTRIKVHVQLFVSFIINNILAIIWYTQVVTRLEVTSSNTYWCQLLYVTKEYFMVANYMWMFCEALHLHISLVVVFVTEDKTMKWFYCIGWGTPILIVLVHNMVRIFYSHDTGRCFMEEIGFSTWFISVPIVITLASSMIFLINILRVILMIMHPGSSNPAPDSVRRAVRAALILTPLFGLQFIFIPVKPDPAHPLYSAHQYLSMTIIAYQGLCCAILFCFVNNEVHQAIKRSFQRKMHFHNTRSTNYPTADSGGLINGQLNQSGTAIPLLSIYRKSVQGSIKA